MDKEQYSILFRMEEAHWWYLGMQQMVGSLLDRHLNHCRVPRILDAGCGTGGMSKYLCRFGSVTSVDLSRDALSFCQRRGLAGLVGGSVEHLPFVSHSFDLLVSLDVLYHMSVGDDSLALEEFNRVLRPGGLLLVRVPANDWLRGAHDVAVHTRHRYSRREMEDKLLASGFRIDKLTHVNSLLFPIAALKRLAEGTRHTLRPDLELPSPQVNRWLQRVLRLESAALSILSFPWGLSVLAVARKAEG